MPVPLVETAPAKINLTLRVLARRVDGYHEISSLVVFADCGDRLTLAPGGDLALTVHGPSAAQAGQSADNLVLKAARALAERFPDIVLGCFDLEKNLPVAAGIGGGSADAAAALRLLARANDLSLREPGVFAAARATGADVPVCLEPRPRLMSGIGEKLSEPLAVPPLHAVLVNPGVALATKDVFAGWTPAAELGDSFDVEAVAKTDYARFLQLVAAQPNDLEPSAVKLAPVIGDVLAAVRALADCRLARMSGSGATCFGLFDASAGARHAAVALSSKYPQWWVHACVLGDAG